MAVPLEANTTWFNFVSKNGHFSVYSFTGEEEINRPFVFSIELVSRSANEDLVSLLGTKALLIFCDQNGGRRPVHGFIGEMEQLHTAHTFTHYRCVLVPRLWYLDKISDHRIFQGLSVLQIIEKILKEQGFPEEDYAFKVFFSYEPREYCVQNGESDLHFISRLCEEEGLYFYFEHTEDRHRLCFSDREGGPRISGIHDLRFHPGSGQTADTGVISRLGLKVRVNSNASTYREWNFEKPSLNLEMQTSEPDPEKAPVPEGMLLEQYRYPHLYRFQKEGGRYVNLQLLRQLTFSSWIEAESDVVHFMPGYTFSVNSHPRFDLNAAWWGVSVRHEGRQPGVLEHEAPDGQGLHYRASVKAIPEMRRFIATHDHPKQRIDALQSAIVTGPEGEEVYTDSYGRVKVQFHWDRIGASDEKTSCWVRVADSWAGASFGFIQVPRIGQEVIVEYMDGDPDRPVVTGRVYNGRKMPPWELPGQKMLSGIQSREFQTARRNQLVFDDTQGEIQAQLASDHHFSQLNLGYLTRVEHRIGRKDFRGEGFELRTDGWGAVRAARGIYIGTDARSARCRTIQRAVCCS